MNSTLPVRTSAKEQVPPEISASKFAPTCSNVAYTIARLFRACIVLWLRSYTFGLAPVLTFCLFGLNFLCCCFISRLRVVLLAAGASDASVPPAPCVPLRRLVRLQKLGGDSSPSDATMASIATTHLGGDTASPSEDQYEYGSENVFNSITKMADAQRSQI